MTRITCRSCLDGALDIYVTENGFMPDVSFTLDRDAAWALVHKITTELEGEYGVRQIYR